jgi:thiol-disulfide isomerase/thioredoxin
MKNMTRNLLTVTVALAVSFGFKASSATLNVGDPAPKLQTGKFVQGDPVTDFSSDKAYIVEFWATWCGPCKASIPHLNEVYAKYKDKGLVVIGQDCWEKDDAKVPPFVKSMGGTMTYRVALDSKEGESKGKMAETWMMAAGQNGIPTAFLIDKSGHIAWIGHPMTLDEKVIDAVLAGTYDVKKAAADYAEEQKSGEKVQSLSKKLSQDMQSKDWDAASADLDELEKLRPEWAQGFKMARYQILSGKKDFAKANTLLREMAESTKNDPATQNELAWMLVSDKNIEHPNLDLAQTMAQRAVEGAKANDQKLAALDTLARVKFLKGDKNEAVKLEQQSVDLASGEQKDQLQKTLDSYKEGKLADAH